jgi:hypothetical protein
VKALRGAALVLAASFSAGCPMTPRVDDVHPKGRLIEPALAGGFLQVGTTTREDVLLTLGEPDAAAPGDASFTYRWSMLTHYASGCFGPSYVPTAYTLLVDFDPQGRVKDFQRSPPR